MIHSIPDQSTWVLNRKGADGKALTGVVEGNLSPGIYRYLIKAVHNQTNVTVAINEINADVRHWGTESALTLEWEQQPPAFDINDTSVASGGSDFNYEIYRYDNDKWLHLVTTRDHKYYDVGKELDLDISITNEEVEDMKEHLPPFRLSAGRNANVRSAGHVTEEDLIIYIDNTDTVPDWQREIVNCMYREIVPADVRFKVFFLNEFN